MVELLYKHHHLQEEEQDEEQEEALSLCDLPLNDNDELQNDDDKSKTAGIPNRRTSSSSEPDPDQLFEFFSNFSSEMSSAEDIIFCGKLVPFKDLSPDPQIQTHYINSDQNRQHSSFRRRSESLSGLQYSSVSRSNSINSSTKFMMRNSRSLDYRRLERFSSSKTSSSESENSIDRNSSSRSSIGRGDSMSKRTTTAARPRWYVLMFGGVVKPPVEMELSDIKSRQVRRNISSKKKPPISKSTNNTPSCRLLKVLSCRDNTSVAVTTPLWIPPPA